ncbi:MAG: helix-turn-helix domain-containing protein [Lachnospiraceae bacterium]|nr:helix-turn-helix domain-containing protein [Lachnospiraceae bacterium]
MDQKKTGNFLKKLRKEKGITQEQLAERFYVSSRTVSRWETGTNMPDLDILIEMADYYEVDIRELIDGERKSEIMNKEMEETILKVADYSNYDKEKHAKGICIYFGVGIVVFLLYFMAKMTGILSDGVDSVLIGLLLDLAFGIMVTGLIYTSGYLVKIHAFKQRLQKRV